MKEAANMEIETLKNKYKRGELNLKPEYQRGGSHVQLLACALHRQMCWGNSNSSPSTSVVNASDFQRFTCMRICACPVLCMRICPSAYVQDS